MACSSVRTVGATWHILVRRSRKFGAGEGNRTLVCSLGSCRSAIELRPRIKDLAGIDLPFWLPFRCHVQPSILARADLISFEMPHSNGLGVSRKRRLKHLQYWTHGRCFVAALIDCCGEKFFQLHKVGKLGLDIRQMRTGDALDLGA